MPPRFTPWVTLPILVIAGALALAGRARPTGAAPEQSSRQPAAARAAIKPTADQRAASPKANGAVAAVPIADTTAEIMNPLVYMTWHRPYGMPGASSDLTPSTDPEQRDTLWLIAEPRRDSKLFGISVQLAIHPAAGDTLDPQWVFGGGNENPRHIRVEWPQASWPVRSPWSIGGFGAVHYERRGDHGWLNIIYAINSDSAAVVRAGTRYSLARILFPGMPPAVAKRAVCIEWASGEWAYDLSGLEGHPALGGARFVSVSSPDGSVCTAHRTALRLDPFRYGVPDPIRSGTRR